MWLLRLVSTLLPEMFFCDMIPGMIRLMPSVERALIVDVDVLVLLVLEPNRFQSGLQSLLHRPSVLFGHRDQILRRERTRLEHVAV